MEDENKPNEENAAEIADKPDEENPVEGENEDSKGEEKPEEDDKPKEEVAAAENNNNADSTEENQTDKPEDKDNSPSEENDTEIASSSKGPNEVRERKRLSFEYTEILSEIAEQNKVLNDLKQRIIEIGDERPTASTMCEIRGLRCRLEEEKRNLNCLMKKAIKFQEEHPEGPWEDIPLATNFSEDYMPSNKNALLCTAMCDRIQATKRKC